VPSRPTRAGSGAGRLRRFEKAAEQGSAEAQFYLANTSLAAHDRKAAFAWAERAAASGLTAAQVGS
jgi:TPR repeat protein